MKILAIDVGGTFIKFALTDENVNFFEKDKIPTPLDGREDFVKTISGLFEKYSPEGIAFSLPGIIDTKQGLCITSGALKYNDGFFVVDEFQKIFGVKVSVENDANCAALAEVESGNLRDVKDAFVMVFGTYIGGAFIKDRKVHHGANFSGGEISFLLQNSGEEPAEENLFGENCGTSGICKLYAKMKNSPENEIDGEKFFEAVNGGEEIALTCLDKSTLKIAGQISNLQNILDPEKFAIGGGISAQPKFILSIRENVNKIYDRFSLNLPRPKIVACKFLNDANLVGAVHNFLSEKV